MGKVRRAASFAAALVVVVGLAPPSSAAPDGTAGSPTVTATPDTDLVDGQVIVAHGEGFDEHRDGFVLFMQCPAMSSSFRRCRSGEHVTGPDWGLGGTVDATYRVDAVFRDANGTEVDCRLAHGTCVLQAYNEAQTPVVAAPLTFDPDAPLQPPPTVTVEPDTDLVDGQVVHIEVDGFPADQWLRVAICDGPTLFDNCYEGSDLNDEIGSDLSGHAEGDVRVRTIVTPGQNYTLTGEEGGPAPFDCRELTCHLVIGEEVAGNNDAAAPLGYDPDAPVAAPAVMVASAATGLTDGQVLTVDVTGLFAGESVEIIECSPDAPVLERCHPDELRLTADAAGEVRGTLPVFTTFTHAFLDEPPVDCHVHTCELWLFRSTDGPGPSATLSLSFAGGPTDPTDAAPAASPVSVAPRFTG